MSIRLSFLTIGWLIANCCSCMSFKIVSSASGEHILEKIEFCPNVEEDHNVLRPAEPRDEFDKDDNQICCLIKVRVVSKSLTLRWKWYSPEKKLWKDTGEVLVDSGNKSIDVVSAYDRINRETDELAQGVWTVAVFINGYLAGRRIFKVI
jgi:hypothetical protein